MLVSAMVGLDTRSTMDIDTTTKNIPHAVQKENGGISHSEKGIELARKMVDY